MALLDFQCTHRHASGFALDIALTMDHRFTSLFGPSGSGKTTILSLIAGFLRPAHGRIQIGEQVVVDTDRRIWLPPEERSIGYVFQDALLFPHLSVLDNLKYGQRHRRKRRRSVDFHRLVEVLEIGHLLDRSVHNLSGGERQRIAMGRALLSGPELLLMDEPLASLDKPLKSKVLMYLERTVAEWNVPTLLVTHSKAEVRRVAQWVVVIHAGRLVREGRPSVALPRTARRSACHHQRA